MKETISKAMSFVDRHYGKTDTPGIVADYDGNVALYSTQPMEGYKRTEGNIFVKRLCLTKEDDSAFRLWVGMGPRVVKPLPDQSEDIYVFVPTKRAFDEFGEADNRKEMIEFLSVFPTDSALVHEFGHERGFKIIRQLNLMFGRDGEKHSMHQEELFAKYAEIAYLRLNHPNLVERRIDTFVEEVRDLFVDLPPGKQKCSRDIHGAASLLYFQVMENPVLKSRMDELLGMGP